MMIKSRNINQAAFFTSLGGKLVHMENQYPQTTFFVEIKGWMKLYEKLGIVNYRKYCRARVKLKIASKQHSGLPEHFTGKSEGFSFADIAMVKPQHQAALKQTLKL